MPFDLDALPFPFHLPEAQTLRKNLTNLYPNPMKAQSVLELTGFDIHQISWNQSATDLWHEILATCSRHGYVSMLVQKVYETMSQTSPLRPWFKDLLDRKPMKIDAESRTQDGRPRFIVGDDSVSHNETLLFHDDLTWPIGRIPSLAETLKKLVELAPAVCRLDVAVGTSSQTGTAFRIGPDLLLTNWHVLHNQYTDAPAGSVTADFKYETDATGAGLSTVSIRCDVASIVADKSDDWGVIRTVEPLDAAWPVIALAPIRPTPDTEAYIIQHPGGGRKRLGFARNLITGVTDRVVHYLTDTQGGSSGSPVFDASGRLIALHHAGGDPQQIAGREPIKKNEGIRIDRILAGLAEKGISLA